MLITNQRAIAAPLKTHPKLRRAMARWLEAAQSANWDNILDAQRMFPTADSVKGTALTAFNLCGNDFRLMTIVSYSQKRLHLCELLTHQEYTRKYC